MMLHVSNDVRREGREGRVRCYGRLVTRRLKDFLKLSVFVFIYCKLRVAVAPQCFGCADWLAYISDRVLFSAKSEPGVR